MIDDPIEIQSYGWFSEFCSNNIGKAILFGPRKETSVKYISYIRIDRDPTDSSKYINFWLFRAERFYDKDHVEFSFIFDDKDCSRATFINGIMEKYPNHFEWLLFNQEFLF